MSNSQNNGSLVSLILFLEIVHFHNFHWKEEASVCLWIKGQHYEKGIPFIRNSPFFELSIYRFYKSRKSNYQLRLQSWIWLPYVNNILLKTSFFKILFTFKESDLHKISIFFLLISEVTVNDTGQVRLGKNSQKSIVDIPNILLTIFPTLDVNKISDQSHKP